VVVPDIASHGLDTTLFVFAVGLLIGGFAITTL
jgi:hypothetical protein